MTVWILWPSESVASTTASVWLVSCSLAVRTRESRSWLSRSLSFGKVVLLKQVAEQAVVEIVAAQCAVATGGFDFKQPFGQLQYGYVECTAAQVVNDKRAFRGVVQTVGNRGGGRLVEQTQYVQARQTRGIFGGLALCIVEIGGNGNDSADQIAAQCFFGTRFEGFEDFRRHFDRRFCTLAGVQLDHALVGRETVCMKVRLKIFLL